MIHPSPIYILCPDINIPSGGIKRLYRIASVLHNAGFNACILHEKTGFSQEWVNNTAPVCYADQITLKPNDIIVIPETLPDTMKQIPDFCRKVVHAFSWTYIFQNMKKGETWRDYNIEMALTPSSVIADFIKWSIGVPVYKFETGIDKTLFSYKPETKEDVISFLIHRNLEGKWTRKIFSQLPRDIPTYKWIGISNRTEDEYAEIIRKSKIFLATGIREGVPGSILEALSCGTVVVGYRGVGGNEYLVNDGPDKNFFGVENGDYFALSRSLEKVVGLTERNNLIIEKGKNQDPAHISDNRPSISLCMIVKDEEKLLPDCLKSIKNFVDEIIIVDTGSSDRSIEIAQRYGAKLFQHPWENNFAGHRNQSISYATGDWIFIMDADEEFVHSGTELLRKAVKDDSIDSIAIQVINPVNNGKEVSIFNSIRVFRNNGKIKYEGTVHNKVVGHTRTNFYPAQIIHHGYNLDEWKMKAKFERTSSLLKELIDKEPDNPLPHHYLAVSYMNMGPIDPAYYDRAIYESSHAIKLSARQQNKDLTYIGSYYVVAASHLNLGNTAMAEDICRKALDIYPNHLDSYFLLAKIHDKNGNYMEAVHCAERYLAIREEIENHPERFGTTVNQNFSAIWLMMIILGKAQYGSDAKESARKIFRDVSRDNPANWNAQSLIGDFYFKKADYREAEYFLKKANEIKKEKLFLYMLCECYGHSDKIDEQIAILSDIIHMFPEEKENLKKIGMSQFGNSKFKLASFCLSKVSEMGDKTPEVTRYLHEANSRLNHLETGISI